MIEFLSRPVYTSSALAILLVVSACSGTGSGTTSSGASGSDGTTTSTVAASSSTTGQPSTTQPPRRSTTTTTALVSGDELVMNGDFSVGGQFPDNWEFVTEGQGQSVEYVSESGETYVRFAAPLIEDAPWPEVKSVEPFPVEPHTDYQISLEARSNTTGRLLTALVFLDEDGDEILLRGPGEPEFSGGDWTEIQAVLESPAGAASAHVVLRLALRPETSPADAMAVDVRRVSVVQILGG